MAAPPIGAEPVVTPAEVPGAAAKPALPATEQLPPGEILIRAETQSAQKGHYEFRGFVDLRSNEFRIQADALDYFEDTPEGYPPGVYSKVTITIEPQANPALERPQFQFDVPR